MNRLIPILGGIRSYIPFLSPIKGAEGTTSARYCYSVWLRHLSVAFDHGLTSYPHTIAELGPGNSIGTGLAGLISGARHYYALDVVQRQILQRNVEIFDELVALFQDRDAIPDETEFPRVYPRLESYQFVSDILTDSMLGESLDGERIAKLRKSLADMNETRDQNFPIRYICPWFDPEVIEDECVDMIFSQAVLEHVDDLDHTYETLYRWLKKGGLMSHQIDFKSHGVSDEWNGHWAYSDRVWRIVRGNRPYLLNREPLSTHLGLLARTGFEITCMIPVTDLGGLPKDRLARRYRDLSDEDRTTSSVHIVSVKR
jgi:hypothetical protein